MNNVVEKLSINERLQLAQNVASAAVQAGMLSLSRLGADEGVAEYIAKLNGLLAPFGVTARRVANPADRYHNYWWELFIVEKVSVERIHVLPGTGGTVAFTDKKG
jgi:hypothetical protein